MTHGFWFRKVVKKVEKFWDVGLESVYIRWCKIDYEYLGNCGDRPEKYVMCTEKYQVSKY